IESEGLLENATAQGDFALERLSKFQLNHPSLVRLEGRGLMVGLEFMDAHGKPLPEFRDEVVNQAYLKGLLTLGCGVGSLRIAPPLMIDRKLMSEGLDILERAIAEVEESHYELLMQN
ncbi:MAG: aminotransferase class III-fold pyridoxal phosphate-dependent enzyme, partial [Armatimonadetes bacterium]|nr:aminotransferase class III-fold pyridoxal phosphate-dependent enzyme [Anaerolineae bacterium]